MSQVIKPVFLVEDNPMDADLTLRSFSKNKFDRPVVVARDGEEALAWMERWESGETLPFVVLLDLNLPKFSGMEVFHAYQKHELARQIPVVFLFSSEEDRKIHEMGQTGENLYLVKPINFEKFKQLIHAAGINDMP